jgi:hypothetical protein
MPGGNTLAHACIVATPIVARLLSLMNAGATASHAFE